jgi:Ca-activated chloride channel family protein
MTPVTHVAQPLWLVIGLLAVPLLLLVYGRFDQLQRRRLRAFSLSRDTDSALFAVSRPLLWFRRIVFCLVVVATCLALARPLGSMRMEETERRGLDILFAIDTSRSMLTPDVKPDRLTRAKLAVEDLLDRLNGDGVGLVAFAGEAFLQAPVTTDYDAFRETLEALDTNTIALGGTDIASAIRLSESTLAMRGDTQKVMVLITDGEDLGGDALLAAQAAAQKGMVIFTVGVGTESGELIPVPDGAGGNRFVKDPAGNFVRSHLDAEMLKRIAAATGGVYVPLGPQQQGVVNLYDQKLKELAQHQHEDRQVAVYAELFQWPLAVAIGLLSLEWLLGVGVRRRAAAVAPPGAPLTAALVMGVLLTMASHAWGTPRTAQEEYQKGQYAQAQRDYAQSLKADPTQAQLQFNMGAAAYRARDYATAASAFSNALRTQEIPLQQSAYYNLGNALFRQGEKGVATDPQSTIKTWQQSIGAYNTALQMLPADADAKFNRDVVQKRLDELQKQQDQRQKKSDQNDKDKNDKNDKNNKNNQQNDKQNQQNQQNQQGGQQNPQDQQGQQNPQSQQNPQNQPNQQGQPNQQKQQNQPGQPNQQGQPDQRQAGPTQADPGKQEGQQPQSAAEEQDRGKPGQMSRVEAEQLLDSAKGEERHLGTGVLNAKSVNPPTTPLKDW